MISLPASTWIGHEDIGFSLIVLPVGSIWYDLGRQIKVSEAVLLMRKSTGEFGGAWAGEGVIVTVQGADVDNVIPTDFYVCVPRVATHVNQIC